MKNQRQKKSILINKPFQVRFILAMLAYLILATGFFLWIQSSFFQEFSEMGRSAALPPDHVFYTFLQKQQDFMIRLILISVLSLVAIGIAFSLWFSHRIAGPMARLRSSFEEMSRTGKLIPIEFRKNDFFQEVPTAYNQLLEKIEKK